MGKRTVDDRKEERKSKKDQRKNEKEQRKNEKEQRKRQKNLETKKSRDKKILEEDQSWESLFAEAVTLHHQGVSGDKEAVKKSYQLLTTVRNLVPDNNLVEAYYGSVMTLLGRDAKTNKEKLQLAKKGLKILDQAVRNQPDNIKIRTMRAFVCYRVPEKYFGRTRTAVEDFNYLISRYEQDPNVFAQDVYWKLLYDLGAAYKHLKQKGEARATWQNLLSQTTDPKYQDLLKKEKIMIKKEKTGGESNGKTH